MYYVKLTKPLQTRNTLLYYLAKLYHENTSGSTYKTSIIYMKKWRVIDMRSHK